ncbi:MAG: DUF3313 family protein [Alphaproteobacteria bacterium]|jgi:flagellar biosynthesis component FlhA|uniref:DUF3313 family protein n=1 Tax=Maricaulis alexandrii TaxID=2570354 RepID=UPI001108941A|nr:DUF3313 family protein [Maricaulis alexandrii]MCR9267332.1 DUF3313 family protein [Alphaproteobacteria bacterium]
MKRTITAFFAMAALAAPSLASEPVSISEIRIGDELQEKAEEYGQRELDYLATQMREALERELAGHLGENGMSLDVVILDATPNRPTMEQSASRGLHMSSISVGGASLEAHLFDAQGNELESYAYSWRSHSIRDVVGYATWTDARRAIRRFADDIGESVDEMEGSGS